MTKGLVENIILRYLPMLFKQSIQRPCPIGQKARNSKNIIHADGSRSFRFHRIRNHIPFMGRNTYSILAMKFKCTR